MSMSHLSHERDLDGHQRVCVAVCQRLGGTTTWHQTGDDGRLDATTLAIISRAVKAGGAVAIFSYDKERRIAVGVQIEGAL